MIQVPPEDYVQAGPERAVSVAHAAQEVLSDIAHASRHAGAVAVAQKAANQERIRFDLLHVQNHVGGAITQQNSSVSNLVQLDPRAGEELEKLRDTVTPARFCPAPGCELRGGDWEYAPPGPARGRTPAHLAQTVLVALTHARQHVVSSQGAAGDPEQLTFELAHLTSHVDEAHSHQVKYIGAVAEFFPAVAAELGALARTADVGGIIGAPAGGDRSGLALLAEARCGRCGAPAIPGAGTCDECGQASSRGYERGAAEVRKRWRADLMYDDCGQDGGRLAAWNSSRGRGGN